MQDNVFINISGREHNESLNAKTWAAINKVNAGALSIEQITTQHIGIYTQAVAKTIKLDEIIIESPKNNERER